MSSNTLEVIPINTVPKRGALALKDRDERRLCHPLNGVLYGMLGFLIGVHASLLLLGTRIIGTIYFIPIMGALISLCAVSAGAAVCCFGNYFKERDLRLCLPEGSSLEEAEEDAKLRKAVIEYNTLAQEWNDGDTEDCEAERETHRQLLSDLRAHVCKRIELLREYRAPKALSAPSQKSPAQTPSVHLGHGITGPSSLIK